MKSYFIVRIPRRTVVGSPTVMPTSYSSDCREEAFKAARVLTCSPQNVIMRIDAKLFVYCYYVTVYEKNEEAALNYVRTQPRYEAMRDSGNPVFVYDD